MYLQLQCESSFNVSLTDMSQPAGQTMLVVNFVNFAYTLGQLLNSCQAPVT